jgi:hypothetical protein
VAGIQCALEYLAGVHIILGEDIISRHQIA